MHWFSRKCSNLLGTGVNHIEANKKEKKINTTKHFPALDSILKGTLLTELIV